MVYFTPEHWRDPRNTIANVFADNDYGYMLHASHLAAQLLRACDRAPSELARKNLLDYGCGTGRVARVLAFHFAAVDGYDPVAECIAESEAEGAKAHAVKLAPRKFTTELEVLAGGYDVIACINVLEHLDTPRFALALANITRMLATEGEAFLWVHRTRNAHFFAAQPQLSLPSANIAIVKAVREGEGLRFMNT